MKLTLTFSLCLLLAYTTAWSQGCSDAGFCTMGAMKPGQVYTKEINFKLRSIEFNQYRGTTTLSPIVYMSTLDLNFGITEKTTFQAKVPFQWVKGNLGSTSGIGDISLSATHNVHSTENFHVNATAGFKIPTGKSDLEFSSENGAGDLPMYYQISLGTFDFIAGGSYINQKWMFATAVQVPLIHNNNNHFRFDEWHNYPSQEGYLKKHDIATELKRGTDIMFRAERAFHFSNVDIRAGLLPIIRITKDQIKDDVTDEYVKLEGTTGMSLNFLFNAAYHFNTSQTVKLIIGMKITDRDVNPDGLTRHNVLSLSYIHKFL